MKRLLWALALAIILALALAVPAFAANPVLIFGYEPSGAVPWSAPVEGGKLAQSFTAEVGGRLAAAEMYLSTQSFDSGSLYAELYDIAGAYGSTSVPTGAPLAVSASVAANGPSGFTTFSFSGSDVILEEGHQYALVLREEVLSQAAGWGDSVETGDPAYSGNMSVDTGSGWSPVDVYDFYFRVHVAKAAAEYEPSGAVPWSAPVEGGKLAQSFTAEVGGRLAAAEMYLSTQSFDSGSLYAELYDIAGAYGSTSVPTGAPLAVSASVAANGPSGFTTFSFSGSDVILEEGHQYALVLREEVLSQAAGWGDSVETGDPAYSGNMSVDTGSGWSPVDVYDFYFRVHVSEAVNEAPAITSVDNATFTEDIPNEFTFTTTGYPKPAITSTSGLPVGISLVDKGNGTATLSGTPAAGASWYVYHITITATNGVDPAAAQDFTLTVDPLPAITSDNHCTFTVGTEGTFDISYRYASGTACSGDLPSGVIFNGFLGDTYGSFFGTPDPGTGGVYNLMLTTCGPYRLATQAFTLTVNEAPAITTQPNGQTVNAGQTASFSASATGYPLPSVQWQQLTTAAGAVWQDIPGATSTAYDVSAQSSLNGYKYRAVSSNGVGDPAYSSAALLTVLSGPVAPVVTQQPTGQTVLFGQAATFTAAAAGNPVPTVKWQLSTDRGKHWSDIRGATSPSYTTAPTTLGMSGYLYRAVFRNSAGSVTSDAARLTVNPIPFKVLVDPLQWTGPSHGKYQGTVNLSVTDPSGNPFAVGSVRITGVWKSAAGRVLGTSSGTTDDHGVLRLSARELSARPATFVVTSATKTGYSWQP